MSKPTFFVRSIENKREVYSCVEVLGPGASMQGTVRHWKIRYLEDTAEHDAPWNTLFFKDGDNMMCIGIEFELT